MSRMEARKNPIYFLKVLEKSGGLWGWLSVISCIFTAFGLTVFYLIKQDAWLVKLIIRFVVIDFFLILSTSIFFIICVEVLKVNSYRNKTGVRDIGLVFVELYAEPKTTYTRFVVKAAFIFMIMNGLGFGFAMGASVFIGFNRSLL